MELLNHMIISVFNFLRNLHSGQTVPSHQQCPGVLFSYQPCCSYLFIITILTKTRGSICTVIGCFSLTINNVIYLRHLPIGPLFAFFGKKMPTQIFCPLFNQIFFLLLSGMSFLYIVFSCAPLVRYIIYKYLL